jgi:hypothetical protein
MTASSVNKFVAPSNADSTLIKTATAFFFERVNVL